VEIQMNPIRYKDRLRQKAAVRVANKPWKTLKLALYAGLLVGGGIGFLLSYFVR
jgi:hypothetical protein